jgi:hypothetical protein
MLELKNFTSIPIEFDKQDEGHSYHNARTWNIFSKYYSKGNYPYKKFNNGKILTGPFIGTQTFPKNLLDEYENVKKKYYTVRNLK